MTPDFSIGQDADHVVWSIPVCDPDGNRLDLTGATISFEYRIADESSAQVVRSGSVVGTAPMTEAGYAFVAADTATPGFYTARFVVTLPGSPAERIPYPLDRKLVFEVVGKP